MHAHATAQKALTELIEAATEIKRDADTTYYQSQARPRDQAAHERLKGVATAIDQHRRKNTTPSPQELEKWSAILWTNGRHHHD